MTEKWPPDVDLSRYVRDVDTYPMKSLVPPPIAIRVDQLVDALMQNVRDLGDVSQSELVAALIQTADTDPARLAESVLVYRNARVYETLVDAKTKTGLHPLPPRRVGRPK